MNGQADTRIRRVCRELDALHRELGINSAAWCRRCNFLSSPSNIASWVCSAGKPSWKARYTTSPRSSSSFPICTSPLISPPANSWISSSCPSLGGQLERFGVAHSRLTIEITERAVLKASPLVRHNLELLWQRGIRICLDDFGTGHSSPALLSELRPDELKIDRSFVMALERDPYAHHIVLVITNLAHSLAIDLVAEGVEDASTWTTLVLLGVDRFHGYLVSAPRPWSEISGLTAALESLASS